MQIRLGHQDQAAGMFSRRAEGKGGNRRRLTIDTLRGCCHGSFALGIAVAYPELRAAIAVEPDSVVTHAQYGRWPCPVHDRSVPASYGTFVRSRVLSAIAR